MAPSVAIEKYCCKNATYTGEEYFILPPIWKTIFSHLCEVAMTGAALNFYYKLMNNFVAWPTRRSIEASAERFEALEPAITTSPEIAGRRAACCCVLFWDESIGRPDEPITVSSEDVCRQIALHNNADYRRPLIQGPCQPL